MTSELKARIRGLLLMAIEGPAGDAPCYLETLRQLDAFKSPEFHGVLEWDLRHYLGNRSYVKALNFIDSASANA